MQKEIKIPHSVFIENMEKDINKLLNNGWELIGEIKWRPECEKEHGMFFATMIRNKVTQVHIDES